MQPGDLAHLRTPSAPTLTPDGRLLAVAVGRIDLDADEYRAELWLMPTDGSAPPRRFTSGRRDVRPRLAEPGVLHGLVGTDESEVREAVGPLYFLAIQVVLWIEVLHLGGETHRLIGRVERGDRGTPARPRQQRIPVTSDVVADRRDQAGTCDDYSAIPGRHGDS